MADEPEARATTEQGATRPDLKAPRVSSRVPPVIEGDAQELGPPTPGTMSDIADSLAGETQERVPPYAPTPHDAPDYIAIEADGVPPPPEDEPAPPKSSRAPLWIGALVVLLGAGGLGWLYANSDDGDIMSGVRKATGGGTAAPTVVASSNSSPTPQAPKPAPASPVVMSPTPPVALTPTPTPPVTPAPKPMPPVAVTAVPTAAVPASAPPPATPALPAPQIASAAAAPGIDPARVSSIERRVDDLDGKIAALAAAPGKPARETSAALQAQSTRLGQIEATLTRLDTRLAAVETKLAPPKAEERAPRTDALPAAAHATDDAAARLIVAQSLLTAVEAGAPFAAPLAALRSLGVEDSSLSRLSAAAGSGVPTVAALRAQFAAIRPQMRSAPTVDAGANWQDKMWARVSSLVSIRPASERAGASPEAIASRIDAALGRNDLGGALDQYRTLSAADQARAKDWADGAGRRVAAEADARTQLAAALAALSKPKS